MKSDCTQGTFIFSNYTSFHLHRYLASEFLYSSSGICTSSIMNRIAQNGAATVHTGWRVLVLSVNLWLVWMAYFVKEPGETTIKILTVIFVFSWPPRQAWIHKSLVAVFYIGDFSKVFRCNYSISHTRVFDVQPFQCDTYRITVNTWKNLPIHWVALLSPYWWWLGNGKLLRILK